MPTYRVPASTTNLAHGFDCLGIALGLANRITVERIDAHAVTAPDSAAPGLAGLAERVRDACARAWNTAIPAFSVRVTGDVPIARGMGSSATILVGVAAACRDLAQLPPDSGAVLTLAAALEGHPDNVAAATLGGFTVIGATPGGLRWARFAPPPGLTAVVAIPDFEVKTTDARKILPHELTRADAVIGLQRTALLTAALAQNRLDDLRGLFADGWHERYRATMNPGFAEARAAADAAGALGTIISGSGSTVLALVRDADANAVAQALTVSYVGRAAQADVRVVGFDHHGVTAD